MSESGPRCPHCQGRRVSEVMRRFRLTLDRESEARGQVHIYWICDHCATEWDTVSMRRWDDVHGSADRTPSEYRARVGRYAQRLYRRIFDFPPGSYRDDWDGFVNLANQFGSTLCTRYGGRVGQEIAIAYTLRAAKKLLAHWDNHKNFKYKVQEALNSHGKRGGQDDLSSDPLNALDKKIRKRR